MKPVYIIAEAGVNHNGDMELARQLVKIAAEAGADAVKFQTFRATAISTRYSPKAAYQERSTSDSESQLEMLKKLELSRSAHLTLMEACAQEGIEFLSTAFDLPSAELLHELGQKTWKIPSGEIDNVPLLERVASFADRLIISTGMSELEDIRACLDIVTPWIDKSKLTVLHCNTQYPTPPVDVNLRAMEVLRRELGVSVGYSDHTMGIEIPIAAVALGAEVIEKHITLDNKLPGPDHSASLEPAELAQMVRSIRNVESALGEARKGITESEKANKAIVRKSIVAALHIHQGDTFTTQNITTKRPGSGISPLRWHDLLGRKADREYNEDEQIIWPEKG